MGSMEITRMMPRSDICTLTEAACLGRPRRDNSFSAASIWRLAFFSVIQIMWHQPGELARAVNTGGFQTDPLPKAPQLLQPDHKGLTIEQFLGPVASKPDLPAFGTFSDRAIFATNPFDRLRHRATREHL